jgi:hypothetical protein
MLLEKENVNEVQRHWRDESGTPPPTCKSGTIAWLSLGMMEQCKTSAGTGLETS